MDGPPDSRVFVVCGKNLEADLLQSAFAPFGNVQSVKLVKEKGVAYVKYDRSSSAALAIESLNGAVLNDGRGPKLKVMLAETPTPRGVMMPAKMLMPEPELSTDPDNVPLRSRLFIVVPKQADPQQIQDDIAGFQDVEYCKTDLIATKGVVFCKFSKTSSALHALEEITERGGVAGYKVKCMLAEPKTKRGRPDGSPTDAYPGMQQYTNKLDYGFPLQMDGLYPGKMAGGIGRGHIMPDQYAAMLNGGFNPLHHVSSMGHLSGMDGLVGHMGMGLGGGLHSNSALKLKVSPSQSPHAISRQRLFVVVHKAVTEDLVARLFRRFPGMEYCDLKKDRTTLKSKGYAYVNYSTPEAASAAVDQLNGVEFPYQSGHRIKVMFAEPLGSRPSPGLSSVSPHGMSSDEVSPSPLSHTPGLVGRGHLAADVAAISDSLASLSLPPSGSSGPGRDLMDEAAHHMAAVVAASPGAVARELIFVA